MHIVTGGAGFIGSVFLNKLNSQSIEDILVVDALESSEKWKNLVGKSYTDYLHKDAFLKLIAADKLPKSISCIIHLGACTSTTDTRAEYMMENNYRYSKTLCQWALNRGIRFIYASSAATYGDGALGFCDDISQLPKLAPLNIYAYSKHAFDLWLLTSKLTDKVVGLKFFNVFGPNEYHKQNMTSVVYKAYQQIMTTGYVQLFKSDNPQYKDGEQRRDFVYVKDCTDVIQWFIDNPKVFGIYNLGTGQSRTWKDLISSVFFALDKSVDIRYIDMPDNLKDCYQYFTEAKLNKLQHVGYKKKFSALEDSVKDYVTNYLSNPNQHL